MKNKNKQKVITLIALIITIIILLILAGISISALTNTGLFSKAKDAKVQTKIGTEKDQVQLAYLDAKTQNPNERITEEQLQSALDKLVGENKTKAIDDNENFFVKFEDTGRYYEINDSGNIGEPIEIKEDNTPGILTGSGTEEEPYIIMSIEDLVVFSNMTNGTGIKLNDEGTTEEITETNTFSNKYVILGKTLNFKSKLSYVDYTRKDFGDINNNGVVEELIQELTSGEGFKPIGDYGKNEKKFYGTFEGRDYSILNLYINRENNDYQGLFGYVEGNISHMNISGNIKGKEYCGGITGYLSNGKIENSNNSVNIEAYGHVGGISGYARGVNEINDCYNAGNIVAKDGMNVGGILGTNYKGGVIRRCINEGNITGYGTNIGGVLGSNWNKINSCINIGKIEGKGGYIGGITGYQWSATIKNSYNLGEVVDNSSGATGGIVGWNGGSYIYNCFSIGNISTTSGKIGAITAFNSGTVSNCYYYKDEKINSTIYGINGSDQSGKAEKYGEEISDFYTNEFITEKLKWTAYESKEDIINDEYKCWVITENSRPKLYWEATVH